MYPHVGKQIWETMSHVQNGKVTINEDKAIIKVTTYNSLRDILCKISV